jgi:hypothetical protein
MNKYISMAEAHIDFKSKMNEKPYKTILIK